jgi:hypothetical protein
MAKTTKQIPKLNVSNGVLTITITAEDLAWITEHKPDSSYKVLNQKKFLTDFAFALDNYANSNAVETGCNELQMLIDEVVDETYTNGSEHIVDTEDDQ